MSLTHSVHVSGISSATTESSLHDFFAFCGSINKIDFTPPNATVHFEKPSAAKTALMLHGGTLDGAQINITSENEHHDVDSGEGAPDQSDKPRAGIAAEYLARGYTLSDQILHRAIEIDNNQGISKRFLSYFNSLDQTLGEKALGPEQTISGKVTETVTAAAQQAKAVDESRGLSKTGYDYYARAISTPMGQKVREFYTTTSKQIFDIHEEAKRISSTHKANAATDTPAAAPTTA